MTWKEIGKQIQTARTDKDWTQEKVARVVGLSTQSVQALEHGYANRVPAGQLAAVLTLLELQVTLG